MSIAKELVKGLFVHEAMNEQLIIVKKKTQSGLKTNWSDFSVQSNGDVNTPETCIENELIPCIDPFGNFLDISCGDGSIVVAFANLLLQNNFTKDQVGNLIHIADHTNINILITQKRLLQLGINIEKNNCAIYTKIEEIQDHPIMKKTFRNIVTNPPYQNPGKTKGQKQWYKIAKKCSELLEEDGNLVILTPNSWMSGGQNSGTWGVSKDLFKEKQLVKSKITGITQTYFKDAGMKLGIDISMWHVKNTPTMTTSIIEAEDGIMHVDFRDNDFLSSIPTLASNKVVKQTLGNKNLEKFEILYFDNTIKAKDIKPIEKKEADDTYNIPHYILGSSTTGNLEVSYLDKPYKKDVTFNGKYENVKNTPKIIFTLQSRFWQPHLDMIGMCAISQGYTIPVPANTTQEGFESVFYSKTITYLMKALQIDRNGMMKRSYVDNIPKFDMSKIWTEKEIQEFLELDKEMIQEINERVG